MSIKIAFSTEQKKEHKKGLKKAKKQNKKAIFLPQGKSYAIENINFMLINNDEAILRTEKFIQSILTKKR